MNTTFHRGLLSVLLVLFAGLILNNPAQAASPDSTAHPRGSVATTPNDYVLQINGLACPFCAFGIEKKFSKQTGVENTNVNLGNGVLIVTVTPETRFTDAQLKQIVSEAGFVLKTVLSRPTARIP